MNDRRKQNDTLVKRKIQLSYQRNDHVWIRLKFHQKIVIHLTEDSNAIAQVN